MADWQSLLESFQGNCYPAMVDDLARHLNVSADSLCKIGLGWCPVIPTLKGENYQGWWAFPFRDSQGNVLGLSLRDQRDNKITYRGTKLGLVYDPDNFTATPRATPGKHNWIRVSLDHVCRVCGKPDGCLAAKVGDSAICIRVREGSIREIPNSGFLHSGQPESLAPQSGQVFAGVVVAEGATDVAALADLGLIGVGKASNKASISLLPDLLRGRKVIVLGENDKKSGGAWPGREGMLATFNALKGVCAEVTMLMPPEDVKDFRAWKVRYNLTPNAFLEYVKTHGKQDLDGNVIVDKRPTPIGRKFLRDNYWYQGKVLLKRWEEGWYLYDEQSGAYRDFSEESLRGTLYRWGENQLVLDESAKTPTPEKYTVNPFEARSVLQAVEEQVTVFDKILPTWTNGRQGDDADDYIVFKNGMLHVPRYLAGAPPDRYWLDHTPDLFTFNALDVVFDRESTVSQWINFLQSSLGDDQEKIALLQEWIGYCLTQDTSFQKLLYMVGASRSGKGTIMRAIESILGPNQCASGSFKSLGGDFGLQHLVGKSVCMLGDASTPKGSDELRGFETLLRIVGRDTQSVNRKGLIALAGEQLKVRVMIGTNHTFNVEDPKGAMMNRLNIIHFNKSFADHPDNQLDHKLKAELSGIVTWALEGLRRLRKNGKFTLPPSSQKVQASWRTSTNPILSFLEETCISGKIEYNSYVDNLFEAWGEFRSEYEVRPISKREFIERIQEAVPTAELIMENVNGEPHKSFRGIGFQTWSSRRFHG